jgi:hypothetical protein
MYGSKVNENEKLKTAAENAPRGAPYATRYTKNNTNAARGDPHASRDLSGRVKRAFYIHFDLKLKLINKTTSCDHPTSYYNFK